MTHPQPSTRTRPQPGAWTSPSAGDQTGAAPRARLTGRVGREDGQVTAFVAVLMLALLAMMGLVSDGGRALAAHLSAVNQAQEAARAGAQALDEEAIRTHSPQLLDPVLARSRACLMLEHSGFICGTNADVFPEADSVTVRVHTDVDMWMLTGATSSFDVEGSACVVIGITGQEPTAQC